MTTRFLVCLTLACAAAIPSAFAEPPMVRRAVAAGPLYPADPEVLLKSVNTFFGEAAAGTQPQGRVYALIAPHGGYGLCGKINAAAYASLQPRQYDRVIILAPSHFAGFEGCSIPMVKAFQTPLGAVPLDAAAIRILSFSPLVSLRSLNYGASAGGRAKFQEYEYSIEVHLPFLQARLGEFMLVPILVGSLQDSRTQFRKTEIEGLAEIFRKILDDRTLIIVSSDFTAYGAEYKYIPFKEDVPANIEKLDRAAFDSICAKNEGEFSKYIEETKNPISAIDALYLLMRLVPDNAKGTLLSYARSGDLTNQYRQSVSYAAIAFSDPLEPPAPQRPLENEPDFLRSIGWDIQSYLPEEDGAKSSDAQPAPASAETAPAEKESNFKADSKKNENTPTEKEQ